MGTTNNTKKHNTVLIYRSPREVVLWLPACHPKLQSLSSSLSHPGAHSTYILPPLTPPVCPPPTLSPLCARRFSSPSHGARRCTERKLPFHFLLYWWEQFVPGLSAPSLSLPLCLSLSLSLTQTTQSCWVDGGSFKTIEESTHRPQTVCDIHIHYDFTTKKIVLGKCTLIVNHNSL